MREWLTRRIMFWGPLLALLLAIWAVFATLTGCDSIRPDLPRLGAAVAYGDPRTHAGRDIEREQGIRREAGAACEAGAAIEASWIVSPRDPPSRYRVFEADGKLLLQWKVAVSNPTDWPRLASVWFKASLQNPAPLAEAGIQVRDQAAAILAPNTAQELGGVLEIPPAVAALTKGAQDRSGVLQGVTVGADRPLPSPAMTGPIVVKCIGIEAGQAVLAWVATVPRTSYKLTATSKDPQGRIVTSTRLEAPTRWKVAAILFAEDGRELGRDCKTVDCQEDLVKAEGKILMGQEDAAAVRKVAAEWQPEPAAEAAREKPQAAAPRLERFRVTAYCPCRRCCGPHACGLTATGAGADCRGVAADWAILPPGTMVRINGYGLAEVDDRSKSRARGGRIYGRRLDVRFFGPGAHDLARAWGVQWLEVEILG